MTNFSVDPQGLADVADALASMGPTMQKMQSTGAGGGGALGGSEIESAVTGFSHSWNYGAGQLSKHVEHVAENLGKAAESYAKADASVVRHAENVKR